MGFREISSDTGYAGYVKEYHDSILQKVYPGTRFYFAALSCNPEFNNGMLSVFGFSDGTKAGLLTDPAYSSEGYADTSAFTRKIKEQVFTDTSLLRKTCLALGQALVINNKMYEAGCADTFSIEKISSQWKADTLSVRLQYRQHCPPLRYYDHQRHPPPTDEHEALVTFGTKQGSIRMLPYQR